MEKNGVLRIGKAQLPYTMAYTDASIFAAPYAYIADRMRHYIGEPPKGCVYPVWAWYKYANCRAPDKKRLYEEYGEAVLLTVEIPKREVLLSDFNLYDAYCLHGLPILSEKDFEAYSAIEDRGIGDADKVLLQKMLREASWERLFLPYADRMEGEPRSYIQATLWQITREQVLSAEILTG